MPSMKTPPGDRRTARGEKSRKQGRRSGFGVHRPGIQTEAEHAAIGESTSSVRRPGHKFTLVPKRGV
jgi:hypothetical protein